MTGNMNPASIFVSFISSKEFFSIIHRKLVENYKLNLFDVALDSFEFKIWFGNNPTVHVQDIDLYYGYAASANINGYRLYNPSTIWYGLSLVAPFYVYKVFDGFDSKYFIHFSYTILLLTYVFASRIKVFPNNSDNDDFNWFVDLFFSFYEIIFLQTNTSYDKKLVQKLKKKLLTDSDVFFMLRSVYKRLNNVFDVNINEEKEFYDRLFHDEKKEQQYSSVIQEFVKNANYFSRKSDFSLIEKKILPLILPADIIIRYVYNDVDPYILIFNLVWSIFDKDKINNYISSFRKNDSELESFVSYMSDFSLYKQGFFDGIKKYMSVQSNKSYDHEESEEIDEFMSSIWDMNDIDVSKIPEKLKKESKFMERMLNFYITFVGGLWIARWDNFYFKLFKKDFVDGLVKNQKIVSDKSESLHNYGALLYSYSKNSFYYKYASENVRAGKEKFYVPFGNSLKKAQSNIYIIKLMHQNFVSTIFQDVNQKDIRLYVKNKQLVNDFRDKFSSKITAFLKDDKKILDLVYKNVYTILPDIKELSTVVKKHFDKEDVRNLKDSLYTFDFWLWDNMVYKMNITLSSLHNDYTDMNIMWIVAQLRETVLWLFIYLHYLSKNDANHIDILLEIYVWEILHMSDEYIHDMVAIIKELYLDHNVLLDQWFVIDDNQKYMKLALDNWKKFVKDLEYNDVRWNIIGEDLMWYRWFLKNISYYNKRFVIPGV